MTDPKSVPDLEAALLERAERLAAEYLARGKESRESILREEQDRLRTREERIADEAQADADRLFRRRVQAAQLRVQAALDKERWNLIESVIEELPQRLGSVRDDPKRYESLLQALLAQATASIGEDDLVASFNAVDLEALDGRWQEFAEQASPGKSIELDGQSIDCSGGIRLASRDNRVRVDATFEGRTERFRNELTQTIAERLFARASVQAG
jgi:V/A-type H+-transporting ATPase subunit E